MTIQVNWRGLLVIATIGVLFMFLAILMLSAGCVSPPKGLKLAKKVVTTIPTSTPAPIITETPVPVVSQPAVYISPAQGDNEFMYRTGGRYLGENFGWRRDDVSYLQDMIVNVSVYDYQFAPSYQWWSISWGKYFWQPAPSGMKYLFIFVRMELEGDNQNKDSGVYGFPSKYYGAQYNGRLYPEDTEHTKGIRILEMQTRQTIQGTEPFDYGWIRTYENNHENATQQQYIRMGKSNAWDGYILFDVPVQAQAKDVIITADFQGLGGVAWWKLVTRS